MLREIKSVSDAGQKRRRWFTDDYFDLMLWFDIDDAISGFQLCYDKGGRERALTWRRGKGFIHERVDDGEANPSKNWSPIMVPDGVFPLQEIRERFNRESSGIDQEIRSFVSVKLARIGEADRIPGSV